MNTLGILHSALNASTMRQQTISNNLANAETPGYKAKQVVFEDILKQHLSSKQSTFVGNRSDSRHIPIGQTTSIPSAITVENPATTMQNNGNNVDVDEEMTHMGKNALTYYTLTQQLTSEFQHLSLAIKGRV